MDIICGLICDFFVKSNAMLNHCVFAWDSIWFVVLHQARLLSLIKYIWLGYYVAELHSLSYLRHWPLSLTDRLWHFTVEALPWLALIASYRLWVRESSRARFTPLVIYYVCLPHSCWVKSWGYLDICRITILLVSYFIFWSTIFIC